MRSAKRMAFAVLIDHDLVSLLFNKIAPRFQNRQGGYTRLIKYAINRQGDNARLTMLELTEREIKVEAPKDAKVAEQTIAHHVSIPQQLGGCCFHQEVALWGQGGLWAAKKHRAFLPRLWAGLVTLAEA